MAKLERMKRRVVHQAVRENVATIQGRPQSRRPHAATRFILVGARAAFLVGIPLALFFGSFLLAERLDGRDGDAAAAIVPSVSGAAAAPTRLAVQKASQRRVWYAPRPIGHDVLPLAVRRVILDPGHGGQHQGTADENAVLLEKDITLDIARRLRQRLEAAAFEVVMTRDGDDTLDLDERGDRANAERGDLFVSIHVNWFELPEVRGVETYYLGPTDDPQVRRLAARENQDSGMPMGEFRDALERVWAGVRSEESRHLARAVQRELLKSARTINPEARDRGVKSAPFAVLIRTEMPAILAEVSCLSNSEEASLLAESSYRDYLADALFRGIETYARELNPNEWRGS